MSIQTEPRPIVFASTRFTTSIERRVLHYIRKRNVIAPGERVVGGVSGGPDSTALLVILSRLSPKLRLDITVAHFNHVLRTPEEAAGDLEFVRSLASSLAMPLVHSSGEVRAFARDRHLSIEDAARRLRYAFLAEQASAVAASCVAVGHTLDDQAETVLLHLIRGSGLDGLAGMRPRAPSPFGAGLDLARPSLILRRQETERYCREIGITPRSDPTNSMLAARRNQVRHQVMPVLRQLNPRVEHALARFADAARFDTDYLDQIGGQCLTQLARSDGSAVSLEQQALSELPRALAMRVIRLAFARVHEMPADIEAAHIDALIHALAGPPGSHSLPGGITAIFDQTSLIISKGLPAPSGRIEPAILPVPGSAVAGLYIVEARLERPPATLKTPNPLEAYLDAEKAGANLTVRSRRPGDRLRPLGLGGEKKLQDILVDAKIPARERDDVPLVCAGEQIVWVVGHCIDERYALDLDSRRALHLIVSPANS